MKRKSLLIKHQPSSLFMVYLKDTNFGLYKLVDIKTVFFFLKGYVDLIRKF